MVVEMGADACVILLGNNPCGTSGKNTFHQRDGSAAEVQCRTGWGGFAGVWWWDLAGFAALLFQAGECQECR